MTAVSRSWHHLAFTPSLDILTFVSTAGKRWFSQDAFAAFFFFFLHIVHMGSGLPGWLNSKESACNARGTEDTGLGPWVAKTPCGRKWQPPPVFLLEKSHGQRSLSGCRPKGYKESDTTEQLSTHAQVRSVNNWPVKFISVSSLTLKCVQRLYLPVLLY